MFLRRPILRKALLMGALSSGVGCSTAAERADRLYAQNQYRAAAKAYEALAEDPSQTLRSLEHLAAIQGYHLSDPSAAKTTYLRASSLAKTPSESLRFARAAARVSVDLLDDHAGSVAIFEKLVERFPTFAEAHLELGRAALAAGRLETAEEALRFATSRKSLEPEALEALASMFVVQGRLREATDVLAELTDHSLDDGRRADAHVLAAHCHEALGELGLADEQYARAGARGSKDRERLSRLRSRPEGATSARP